jgi:L-ascorbate metabolism protein UlaG (beta-lactamase superfamily)
MIIQYYGLTFFKVQFGDTVLALNPVAKDSTHKSASFGADIAVVSLKHSDMNGSETVARGDKEPFVITGPGEYEVQGVRIHGFPATSQYGGAAHINTIYLIHLEDMHLLYLGGLDEEPSREVMEELDSIDVLFVPIGGDGVLDAKAAHKLGVKLEARIIIPMLYDDTALTTYLKEEGDQRITPVEKLTLKHKDVSGEEGKIVVLNALN